MSRSISVASHAPLEWCVTPYDQAHALTYARLLDSDADWREAARDVLGLDVDADPDKAHACFQSHLARARWIAGEALRLLMEDGSFSGIRLARAVDEELRAD